VVAGASTDPAALDALRSALDTWAKTAAAIAIQGRAAANALVDETEAEVRARSSRKGALESALQAVEGENRLRLAREVELADVSLGRARLALDHAQEAASAAQILERRIEVSTASNVPRALHELARKLRALSDYAAASIPTNQASGSGGGGSGGQGYPAGDIVDVSIEQASFDDNPIQDGYKRGGADISDYRWAVETWETVVRPNVLAGKTREHFEQRDAEMGRQTGLRRTAGVYDMFLGSDPIQFSRRPDGSLEVNGGRHRVEIAKQLGITHLPGRLHE
jgi:hypothetical protein